MFQVQRKQWCGESMHKTDCSWLYFLVAYCLCFFLIVKSIYTLWPVLCNMHSVSFQMYKIENKLHFDLLGFKQPLSLQCRISRLSESLCLHCRQDREEESPRQRMRDGKTNSKHESVHIQCWCSSCYFLHSFIAFICIKKKCFVITEYKEPYIVRILEMVLTGMLERLTDHASFKLWNLFTVLIFSKNTQWQSLWIIITTYPPQLVLNKSTPN